MSHTAPEAGQQFPLSPLQRRIWWQQQGRNDACFCAEASVMCADPIDPQRLADALRACVAAHALLRVRFESVDGMRLPLQRVQAEGALDFEASEQGGLTARQQEAALARLREAALAAPFDYQGGALLRARLANLGSAGSRLWLAAPAVCADAAAMRILAREVLERYGGRAPGPAPGPAFELVAAWQNQVLDAPEALPGKRFWQEQLGAPPARPFPGSSGSGAAFAPSSARHGLSAQTTASLAALAGRLSVPAHAPYLAAWSALLMQHLDQPALTVGYRAAAREDELAGLVAPLSAHLPLRLGGIEAGRMDALIAQAAAQTELAERWRDAYEADWAAAPGAGAHEAFSFAFDEAPSGMAPSAAVLDHGFGLRLTCGAGPFTVLRLDYDSSRYDASLAQRLLERLAALLDTQREDMPARGWRHMLAPSDREALRDLNRTMREFGAPACLHRLFEQQARSTPGHCALIDERGATSFAALDTAANRWARQLADADIGSEARVGICLERGSALVALMLGVLKAGACYLLIDAGEPVLRLAALAADSRLDLLVCEAPPALAGVQCWRFADALAAAGRQDDAPVERGVLPGQLAYLIHTSGSSGAAKAVGIEHQALCNHMRWMQQAFPLGPGDRVLQKTPLSFDAAVWEFYAPLLAGATLVLAPDGIERRPGELVALLERHAITRVQLVPALLRALAEQDALPRCAALRDVFCGGETLAQADRVRFGARHPARLHNLYGPAEACVDACAATLEPGADGEPPIGRPIANVRIHLLDPVLEPVPAGVEGEVCITGAALARGYLDAPALTAAQFVPDPFGAPGARMYRSGDMARLRADGLLEYLGRNDEQVKIGGMRISAAAVAALLARAPGLAGCVVTAERDDQGSTRLVAYVQPAGGIPAASLDGEVRGYAAAHLPHYLIPSQIVVLDAFPLLANGKIDRAALRLPAMAAPVAPRTDTERQIVAVWAQVLGVERIGVDDNFFQMGGHSILFTQVVLRLRAVFGIDIPLRSIFDAPTPAALARLIDQLVLEHAERELASLLDEVERLPDADVPARLA